MNKPYQIIYIDDNPYDIELIGHAIDKSEIAFELRIAKTKAEFFDLLELYTPDLVLTDFNISGFTGLKVIEAVKEKNENIPIIVVTRTGTEEIAIEAMKMGVSDYVIKTVSHIARLPQTIQSAIDKQKLNLEKQSLSMELKRSEALYRDIYESFPDVYFRLDKDMIISTISPSIINFGYNHQQLKGKMGDSLFYRDDDFSEFLAILEKFRLVQDYTVRLVNADQSVIYGSVNAKYLLDEKGRIEGIQGVIRDISERILSTRKLKESEERYRLLAESSKDAIFIINDQDVITYGNQFASQMLGRPLDKIIGQKRNAIFPSDIHRDQDRNISVVFVNGKPQLVEGFIVVGNRTIYLSTSLIPLKKDTGEVYAVMGVSRDISDRVLQENFLKKNAAYALSIAKISKIMVSTDSYNELMDSIGNEIKDLLGYQNCWFYIFDENNEYARLTAAAGAYTQKLSTHISLFPIREDPYLNLISSAEGFSMIEDVQNDPQVRDSILYRINARTIIYIPAKLSDDLLGSFSLGTFGDEGILIPDEGQKQYLISIASILTFTTDRIRLQVEQQKIIDNLNRKTNELSNFNQLMVSRENKMVELKQEINDLLKEMGKEKKYNCPTDDMEIPGKEE